MSVEGRLQIRQWTAQDGQRRSTAEVVCDRIQALERKRDEAGAAGAHEAEAPSEFADAGDLDTGGDMPGPWDNQ